MHSYSDTEQIYKSHLNCAHNYAKHFGSQEKNNKVYKPYLFFKILLVELRGKKERKKSTFYLSFCCRKTLTWLAYKNAFHRQEHHYNNNHTGVHHKRDSSVHRQGLGLKFQGRRSYSLIFLLMCDSLDLRYLHLFFLIWYSDDCGQYIRKVLLFEFFTHKFHCWECE